MRLIRTLTAAAVVALLSGGDGRGQALSTSVFPSEDELLEALRSDEIDYFQYLILCEIAQQGVDSARQHLLDEIPNLLFLGDDTTGRITALEADQITSFADTVGRSSGRSVNIRYSHYQALDDETRRQSRLSLRADLGERWQASMRMNREYSGRQRWVGRGVEYRAGDGFVRQLTAGSFTARLGLGTVLGYRGKILTFSDRLDGESFLFPDYGGFNGLYMDMRTGKTRIQAIESANRDDGYSMVTTGGMISRESGRFRPAIIIAANRLANRVTGAILTDVKTAGNVGWQYGDGYGNLEIAGQLTERRRSGAAVAEGRHRVSTAEIDYAAWIYDRNYIDLTSGSKAVWMSGRQVLDAIDYELTSRRTGQKGLLMKTVVQLEAGWELANSAILAERNQDTSQTELFSSLRHQWNRRFSTQIDYLTRSKERNLSSGDKTLTDSRVRLEARFEYGGWSVRSYIAYSTDSDDGDYYAAFCSVRGRLRGFGSVEAWSNISRFKKGIERWYIFFRYKQEVAENIAVAVKYATVFEAQSADRFRPVLSMELSTSL